MAKKRKLKKGRLFIIVGVLIAVICLLVLMISLLINLVTTPKTNFKTEDLNINELDYSEMQELDLPLYSQGYMLIRLNDFKVLYGKGLDNKFYPASLTKVLTLDAALDLSDSYEETTYLQNSQYWDLITDNASIAGIDFTKGNVHKLNDLFYALILPSGADAAVALDNYANDNLGTSLVTLMQNKTGELGLSDSNFTNTTGLHDDHLYTTLNDYAKIVLDVLQNSEGKTVLKTLTYDYPYLLIDAASPLEHTLIKYIDISDRDDGVEILGGKTGYTPEAGQNVMVLYTYNNRSYMLILRGATGESSEHTNLQDVTSVLNYLYD